MIETVIHDDNNLFITSNRRIKLILFIIFVTAKCVFHTVRIFFIRKYLILSFLNIISFQYCAIDKNAVGCRRI